MIKTINDLLVAIRDKGIKEIEPFLNIKHGPTIGNMYEGLTKEIVSKALFESTDIRVASGFITNSDRDRSKQIDCMIVVGNGQQIPKTNDYIYDISQVIMVIEVKRNLHSKELSDGYDNLRSVCNITKAEHNLRANLIDDAFEAMAGKPAPEYEHLKTLPVREQMLYHALVVEALLPLRIIFGFEGFKTELSLREKFQEYLQDKSVIKDSNMTNMTAEEVADLLNSDSYERPSKSASESKYGFGAVSLPNLIIAGESSIVKTNGMPYGCVINETDDYCWMASYRRNPLLLFLELLWTRLTYYYDLPATVFSSNVMQEGLAPLLFATGTKNCWIYQFYALDEKGLQHYDDDKPWEPTVLEKNEFILMNLLCDGCEMPVSKINKYIDSSAEEIKAIITKLNKNRLVYVDGEDDGILRLLTKECLCAIDPEYGYVAGDNHDGRFLSWLSRNRRRE